MTLHQPKREEDQEEMSWAGSGTACQKTDDKVPKRRSSALRFFTSNSPPKHDLPAPSQKQWEAEYLKSLRASRPARPSGSRPLPPRNTATSEPYARAASALSLRPSLLHHDEQKAEVQERPTGALLHRRAQSDMPRASLGGSLSGRALVQPPAGRRPAPDFSGSTACFKPPATDTSPVTYRENGMRWMEKQEARALREAMEEMDLREEAKIHAGAQDEAADLVWRHMNDDGRDVNRRNYREHLQEGSHASSQSRAWGDCRGGKSDKALGSQKQNHRSSALDGASQVSNGIENSDSSNSVASRPKGPNDDSHVRAHIKWDSPEKKAYTSLAFTTPDLKSGPRRSSGAKKRLPSGGPFINPKDQIYEDPDTSRPKYDSDKSTASKIPVPLSTKATDSAVNTQTPSKPFEPPTKIPASGTRAPYRSEIQRNPPSQSRDPAYTQTQRSTSNNDARIRIDDDSVDALGTQNDREVRANDIRAATSKRLKDRSPKLPTPSFVSAKLGQHIVSFDKDWKPRDGMDAESTSNGAPFRIAFKPPLPASVASAPVIPTINVSQGPSISVDAPAEDPSVPLISVTDDSAPAKQQKQRPLPTKSKPASRPLPHHSSTTPINSFTTHWSPANQRTTAQCAACALPIAGRIVSAAAQRFHPHCFTCHQCSEPLECVAFYPEPEAKRAERVDRIRARQEGADLTEDKAGETAAEDGDESLRFYCHLDFHESFSPRCRSCKTPIESEVVVACGGTWHVGHFFCAECGDPFDPKTPFVEKDGYAWCVRCHAGRFSGKCKGCRKPVVEQGISALGAEWHEGCFVCVECGSGFDDGRFFTREDEQKPVCVKCEERRLKS